MQVRVLGSAAGGGSPQWNCRCATCEAVRAGAPGTQPRMQSSIAVRAHDAAPWLLVNTSPDATRQVQLLRSSDDDAPMRGVRDVPFRAILLTDAEIDHASGLLQLREADAPHRIHATAPVRRALQEDYPIARMLEAWCGIEWVELSGADEQGAGQRDSELELTIESFNTGVDAPRYQSFAGGPGTSIGVTIRSDAGASLTFAPTIETWSDALEARLAASDLVLCEGTFWHDDELARAGAGTRTATQMGHLALSGEQGLAARLAGLGTQVVLVHINNTNPILVDGSAERAQLDALGIVVARDGLTLDVG